MKELSSSYYLIIYPVVLLCAATITWVVIPSILHVSRARRLYDDLGHFRKQHDHGVPRLGGIAIFVSFTITSLLFAMQGKAISINYLYTACTILFAMGIKDDLAGVHFSTKFVIQFLVALVLVLLADIRLTSMYGVLGIYALPYWPSVALSILTIILIVNAFNLIDGIDGLAATTGIIVNATFAGLFIYMHQYQLAAVALTITGAVIGFLKFNITPAKIFMGDTGSLLIGLISVVMAIRFIELNQFKAAASPSIFSAPALSVAILIGPVFDSIRVFVLRICNGVSPFSGDRNHIHHRVVNLGFSHMQATVFLATMNLVCIAVVFLFQGLGNSVLLGLLLLICLLFNWGLSFFTRSSERNKWAFRNLFN